MLCASLQDFQDFQDRPGPNFYRAIYFPKDQRRLHFIWLEFDGYHHLDS